MGRLFLVFHDTEAIGLFVKRFNLVHKIIQNNFAFELVYEIGLINYLEWMKGLLVGQNMIACFRKN